MRGISRRLGSLLLRDPGPIGALRSARSGRWSLRPVWGGRTGRRAARGGAAGGDASAPDYRTLDQHVLDYRLLDGLRLVFGEIYADY